MHVAWTDGTFALGDSPLLSCEAAPLHDDEPMDLQRVVLHQPQQHLTLVMTVDQLDQLEHELERARWHRTFRQAELRKAATAAALDPDENPPEPDVIGGGPFSGEHAEPWVRP